MLADQDPGRCATTAAGFVLSAGACPSNAGTIPLLFQLWNLPALAFPPVTSREEHRALTNLAALLARDLSKVDLAELAQGVRDAESTGDRYPEWSGRLIAALHRQGKSWSEIAALTEVSQTTAYRRAAPYL